MVKKVMLILLCSVGSFVLLATILSILAWTRSTPFGQFLDIVEQNQANPSDVYQDESYHAVFQSALSFVLYFIISPIIIATGVIGAIIGKNSELLVGIASILPMLAVYVLPFPSIENLLLAFVCIAITIGCAVLIQKNRKQTTGLPA